MSADYDIIIKNGSIIDGSGSPPVKNDIGIKNDTIITIGTINTYEADTVIDASGYTVVPGFIDIHSHADMTFPADNTHEALLRQGITTVVSGNCGFSLAPIREEFKPLLQSIIDSFLHEDQEAIIKWSSFADFLQFMDSKCSTINYVPLVGFLPVRLSVLGMDNRTPSSEEISMMQDLVEEAMVSGAFGFSTGLIYPPQMYADIKEIVEVAKPCGHHNGMYFSHIRNESDEQITAIKEFLTIGKDSGCNHAQLSHHKIGGKNNWGSSKQTLKLIENANDTNFSVRCDQYPYLRGANTLADSLPGWVRVGGQEKMLDRLQDPELTEKIRNDMLSGSDGLGGSIDWNNIYISSMFSPDWKDAEGFPIAEITKQRNLKDDFSTFIKILIENQGRVGKTVAFGSEEDLERIMKHKFTTIGTDSAMVPYNSGKPHPRFYGTYPKILAEYTRKRKWLTLPEAIYKMTGQPAETLGFSDRGFIREGMKADIVIFNAEKINTSASYTDPHKYPTGIDYVIVNGQLQIMKNKFNPNLSGKIIRKRD